MFQDVYLRMEHGNRNCYKDVRQILCRIQLAIIPLTVVLLSQQAKKQFLVSTYQKADDDAIVKTRKKGFQKTAKFSKSLGISLFLGFFSPFLLVSWQKTYRLCVAWTRVEIKDLDFCRSIEREQWKIPWSGNRITRDIYYLFRLPFFQKRYDFFIQTCSRWVHNDSVHMFSFALSPTGTVITERDGGRGILSWEFKALSFPLHCIYSFILSIE